MRVSWIKRRTNASILAELSIKEKLSTSINKSILKYFGHIMRWGGDALERLIVQGVIEGKRPRGRSPSSYIDQIKRLTGSAIYECTHNAMDRDLWRDTTKNYPS